MDSASTQSTTTTFPSASALTAKTSEPIIIPLILRLTCYSAEVGTRSIVRNESDVRGELNEAQNSFWEGVGWALSKRSYEGVDRENLTSALRQDAMLIQSYASNYGSPVELRYLDPEEPDTPAAMTSVPSLDDFRIGRKPGMKAIDCFSKSLSDEDRDRTMILGDHRVTEAVLKSGFSRSFLHRDEEDGSSPAGSERSRSSRFISFLTPSHNRSDGGSRGA